MATTAFEMENTRALSDPTLRARFSLSFSAQMMLSQESVKESCAAAANALLSFSGVRYRTAWTGIYFTAGGKRIAALAFFEDSLCLLLAQSAEAASGPRYKAQDVSQLRRFEKTPALLPLKSEGALKNALKKWADLAATLDLREKDAPAAVFAPESFPEDSFESLLRRGLIRPTGKYSGEEGAFVEVLSALSAGEATIKLSEKKMLRALDEGWVERIEQALPAIDELLRRPSHFIAETEEIRPMELTRKITGRSVAHLCQHTDFISSVDGDEVTPSKMLNIIREDSILTYENKFLNTLLANLYFFVSERYRIALENGVDERISSVRFTDSFYHGQAKSLVTINIQRSEKITDAKGVQKSYFGSRLWKRVEQLNDITRAYIESDFVREMGRNYVKPPILRTNAILKNKYFRQCLDLWTYLQSYEESGCGLTVEETILQPDQKYVGGLFGAAAAQYLEFCRSSDERTEENILTSATSPTLNARLTLTVEDEADPVESESFTAVQPAAPRQPRDMAFAVQVALKAAAFYDARGSNLRLEKDMEARLRLADEAAKARFAQLVDALRSYEAVKMIPRRTNYAFYLGKTVLARLTIKAGEVLLYIALEPGKLPKAFKVTDVSAVKRYAATPTLLRIKTDGQLAAARKLIERLEKKFELKKTEPEQTFDTAQYEPLPFEELLDRGLVRPAQKPERAQPAKPTPAREEIQPIVTYGEPEGEEMTPGAWETIPAPEELTDAQATPEKQVHTADYFSPAATAPASAADRETESGEGERLLPPIQYPAAMDYSRPAQKGLDDVGGFLADSRENPEPVTPPAEKPGFLARLLRRKKDNKDNE